MPTFKLDADDVQAIAREVQTALLNTVQRITSSAVPTQPYMSVPAELFGDQANWGQADRHWGWVFGSYELWGTDQVCKYLGDCSRRNVDRLRDEGKIRSGRTTATGGRRVYCSRSVAQYAASLQE